MWIGVLSFEDDDVPSQSFFPFCKELLERYKADDRINMICGLNNLESVDSPYSYLFFNYRFYLGLGNLEKSSRFLGRDYALNPGCDRDKLFEVLKMHNINPRSKMKVWQKNKESGVEHYETILGLGQYVNNRLNIVPTQNMIVNIGNTPEGSTHSASGIEMIPES